MQQNTLGSIAYEITNYPPKDGRSLGNVNLVISDRKIWNATPTNAFRAVILSKTDYTALPNIACLIKERGIMPTLISLNKEDIINRRYYFPFGQEISSRNVVVEDYRYGYNGMESDDETKGSGNSYTTEFRQYDPRLGRWLSLDPLMAQYPMMSPYMAFNNNPIYFVDPLGLEGVDPGEDDKKIPGQENKKGGFDEGDYKDLPEVTVSPSNQATHDAIRQNFIDGKISYQKFMDMYRKYWEFSGADENVQLGYGPNAAYNAKAAADNWMYDAPGFCRMVNKAAFGAVLLAAAPLVVPSLIQGTVAAAPYVSNSVLTLGRLTVNGFKLYHKTIGMNGGYVNAGLNWINQSYVQGGKPSNYLSLEGKSLTGLIMAGSMGYSSMILKQAAVGAADPWLNVTLDNGTLKNKGYLLNFSADKPTLQKTTALSVIGAFGPLYGSVPLFNNGALNFGIQQLMLTPAQKAINEKK